MNKWILIFLFPYQIFYLNGEKKNGISLIAFFSELYIYCVSLVVGKILRNFYLNQIQAFCLVLMKTFSIHLPDCLPFQILKA